MKSSSFLNENKTKMFQAELVFVLIQVSFEPSIFELILPFSQSWDSVRTLRINNHSDI